MSAPVQWTHSPQWVAYCLVTGTRATAPKPAAFGDWVEESCRLYRERNGMEPLAPIEDEAALVAFMWSRGEEKTKADARTGFKWAAS